METKKLLFPFTSIVGQEDMKKALLLNIIDPSIGGVLIKGEKGTAKSTMVRSLVQILPERKTVKGCVFNCNPDSPETMCQYCQEKLSKGIDLEEEYTPMNVVELPLSSTEDRVAGTLDLEHVLKTGEKKFEPGVLAQANGNLLYVDEVNLLDDHIVDLLLDSAAMGVNTVEREGISFSHPANFILVGTMNPEEGELRPQLLDRFGFSVEIKGIQDPVQRVEIVKLRGKFEEDPTAFIQSYANKEHELAYRILQAQKLLPKVEISDEILLINAKLSIALEVDGHRADLIMMKAEKAMATFEGRSYVTIEDVEAVAKMVFLHRLKSLPFESSKTLDMEVIQSIIQETVHE